MNARQAKIAALKSIASMLSAQTGDGDLFSPILDAPQVDYERFQRAVEKITDELSDRAIRLERTTKKEKR